ncbi:unnamed protein product [Pleuronectes platessa]|uniref:Uncharacterized protein n=1 Tax=Pleuronectes platessa TaxID=8262 RepID=A0A9N7UPQ9_PLEPL|nr:unnamed protein product [Pleuronectes platessa]
MTSGHRPSPVWPALHRNVVFIGNLGVSPILPPPAPLNGRFQLRKVQSMDPVGTLGNVPQLSAHLGKVGKHCSPPAARSVNCRTARSNKQEPERERAASWSNPGAAGVKDHVGVLSLPIC